MNLSDEQKNVIESDVENKLLLAGPGTGKSYTILGYIKYLIEVKEEDPENIYVLTFTRAATNELKQKIKRKLGENNKLPKVFTLHGFALRQLVKNKRNISSLPENFKIADDYEERHIIMEDIKKMLNSNIKDVRELFNRLSSNWETLNADTNNWEENFDNPEFIGAWYEHRETYGYVLRSELVYQFKNILEEEKNLNIDGPINYLIVDEYQDLNRCDLKVLSHLNKKNAKLFCAGDDDQSIYGFRYAYPDGIRTFIDDISNSEQFKVTKCFRCGENILQLAQQVIRQDHRRIPKTLSSVTGTEGNVNLLKFNNQRQEAKKISSLIYEFINNRDIKEEDILILLRSDSNNVFSQVIINELKNRDISVDETEKYDIFNSKYGRYLIALFKFFQNDSNDLALRTILQLTSGIGEKTIESIYNCARRKNKRFNKILKEDIENIANRNKVESVIDNIYTIKESLAEEFEEKSLEEIISYISEKITIENESFIDGLNEIINEENIETMEDLVLLSEDIIGPVETSDLNIKGVRVMTMHQAKGLTAKVVFVVAAEEEYIPGKGDIDEERRLLYVSLTRAKNYLFITYCNNRDKQQRHYGYMTNPTSRRTLTRYLRPLPTIKSTNGNNFVLDL